MTPMDWMMSGDTGTSSKTICAVMTGSPSPEWSDTPSDADDFGRCYRLLALFPAWRARLPEVAQRHLKWGPLVREWDELTALYVRCCEADGRYATRSYTVNKAAAKSLYVRLNALNDEGRIADGWKKTGPGSWEKGKASEIHMGNLTIKT